MIDIFKRLLAVLFIHKDQTTQERRAPSESQIDKTLKDSFPASDPPGNY